MCACPCVSRSSRALFSRPQPAHARQFTSGVRRFDVPLSLPCRAGECILVRLETQETRYEGGNKKNAKRRARALDGGFGETAR